MTGVLERIAQLVEDDLARDRPDGTLSGETIRRIQMFEDPQRLDDVTTLHGLKRYLHSWGFGSPSSSSGPTAARATPSTCS